MNPFSHLNDYSKMLVQRLFTKPLCSEKWRLRLATQTAIGDLVTTQFHSSIYTFQNKTFEKELMTLLSFKGFKL
jgi:hypothetical protein